MFNKNRTDFQRTEELGHCDALACLMYSVRSQDKTLPNEDINNNYRHDTQFIIPTEPKDDNIIKYNSRFSHNKKLFNG